MITLSTIFIFLITAVQMPEPSNIGLKQEFHDTSARKNAAWKFEAINLPDGDILPSASIVTSPETQLWHSTTNEEMQARSGYWSPEGYQFHRSVRVDIDHDNVPDVVEFVENGELRALRVIYGKAGKSPEIILKTEGVWSDQGLFLAGPHAVMINNPESTVMFLYQWRKQMMTAFIGE